MTVIATLVTKEGTVHASDSLITKKINNSNYEPMEWERSKIVTVRPLRGAMSCWGLNVCKEYKWSTVEWLRKQVEGLDGDVSPEEFAQKIADELKRDIYKMNFKEETDYGIGIHFTAYERIEDYWIPEMFLISNWGGPTCESISDTGVGVSRQTFSKVNGESVNSAHRETEYRLIVHKYLQDTGNMIIYCNGDPRMFNIAAYAILGMMRTLRERGRLTKPGEIKTLRSMARLPIEMVSNAQREFCREGTRIVGGKPHDLSITHTGEYDSDSGDDKV